MMRRQDRQALIHIGYWRSDRAPNLLDPRSFIDESWDPKERDVVIHYLENCEVVASYRGSSRCRFCGVSNGSQERSDNVYIWPSGYPHYLRAHHVKPPSGFLDHLRKMGTLR